MVAKILSSTSTFNGVSYNTNKADKDLGELMKVANFGYLQNVKNLQPEEYKNYLLAHSAINTTTKDKQFHAAISCEGRSYDKYELTRIAEAYLKEMGYGDNPYLVVFHKDTDNNHVHVVTSRIGHDGNMIDRDFEHRRSMWAIQKIMKNDIKEETAKLITKASTFNISTVPQYKLLFEKAGYNVTANEQGITLRKYDDIQAIIPIEQVNKQITESKKDKARVVQLRKIIDKYKDGYSSEIRIVFEPSKFEGKQKPIGYTSDLAEFLKSKFGLDVVFHGKDNLPPYAYTIIDNTKRSVFKGGEIMSLKEFIQGRELRDFKEINVKVVGLKEQGAGNNLFALNLMMEDISKEKLAEIATILKSSLYDYNSIDEGLHSNNISVLVDNGSLYIHDKESGFLISANRLLKADDYDRLTINSGIQIQQKENEPLKSSEEQISNPVQQPIEKEDTQTLEQSGSILEALQDFDLNISNDVDDSQINGRNRRREKKSRTNTR
jgi:hypothetical protein